jgi:membrane-bound serine protease (ClpP class)
VSWLTALGLCVAGLAAIIVEFFVPAAGIIGLLGLGSIIGGIVIAYTNYGNLIGSLYLIGAVVATPAVIAAYFKLFPKSAVGRWLILGPRPGSDEFRGAKDGVTPGGSASGAGDPPGLRGSRGTTVSALRPAGTVRIDGRKYSVVTGGEFVEPGRDVVVTEVRGAVIRVRETKADDSHKEAL